ncbi:MAG: cryptochrome/photolyase family protein, partial [Marinomonas sp.]
MTTTDLKDRSLILVLGDQLSHDRGALKNASPDTDCIVMAEVQEEATYVRHSKHKIAYIFSAMRHFRDELRERGFRVYYYPYEQGLTSLHDAVELTLKETDCRQVLCCEPGEYRL